MKNAPHINNSPDIVSTAVITILHDMGNAHPTAHQVQAMAATITNTELQIGFEGALGLLSANQVRVAVVNETIYGTDTSHVTVPTYGQAEATIHLLGQPNGLDLYLFG